ncbi:MAG: nucleoside triphosphate hydrolase [Rhodobacteraceae bacterium]|jgi:pantothenate kinase|uniref:nucleoside triphosphate hydrolase n=1 Tax=Albidovulum sp. TaxID=1872424 RepID=UPI001D84D5A8|nr:nucleoside triphosphate hydrolase [uncultured Defluviimonas sp.]MCB2126440.1 nucleoside triphosphate hydrolase [Paracoccaceae bacterium]MCC0070413.1 nucleoside triphosphate hydrolase [Paracoccaceae bacterium]
MDETIDAAGLLEVLRRRPRESRTIVAIAGAPGSGKSTLAEALVDGLNARDPGRAALLPMDGFHFDDRVLDALGRRARKGAPDTFDVGGLDHALARLGARDEAFVAVPVFDRGIEIARAGARLIPAETPVIVAEGNYLLLAEPPWNGLARHFDLTVRLDVPEDVLRQRLSRRWQGYGLSPEDIARKLEENDLPNGRIVAARSRSADLVIAPGIWFEK